MVGTDPTLTDRFRKHYRRRVRVAESVAREVRGHSFTTVGDGADAAERRARREAASAAVNALLLPERSLPVIKLELADLPEVDKVIQQLKALSDSPTSKHGGEAQIIVLAARAATESGGRHVILSNDGGASVVASRFDLPSRHAADVLAEFACADGTLTAHECSEQFAQSLTITRPPKHSIPSDASSFECAAIGGLCAGCDATDEGSG